MGIHLSQDLKDAPKDPQFHLQDGELNIYFESSKDMNAYKVMHVERPGVDLRLSLDNPTEDGGTDWN